ncbi:MAG: hypothetical protein ACOC4F_02375 [bacterium]
MDLIIDFLVFFLVYGGLHFLFTERKRLGPDGAPQPLRKALLRSAAIATLAGVLFVFFMEVVDIV